MCQAQFNLNNEKFLQIFIYSTNVYFACLLKVSVGALLAFTTAAISVLILTYIPPNEVPLPPSIDSESMDEYAWSHLETNEIDANKKPLVVKEDVSIYHPLISKHLAIGNCEL